MVVRKRQTVKLVIECKSRLHHRPCLIQLTEPRKRRGEMERATE
jgi:hypothetical protein